MGQNLNSKGHDPPESLPFSNLSAFNVLFYYYFIVRYCKSHASYYFSIFH